jgi:1,4-alpha-glucan branching enzyme
MRNVRRNFFRGRKKKGGNMAGGEKERNPKEAKGKARNNNEVEFTCDAREAKKIFVAGTFNDWNTTAMPMKKGKDGTWKLKVRLPAGNYEYKYFVDGAWAEDMTESGTVPNYFGTRNRVMSVT